MNIHQKVYQGKPTPVNLELLREVVQHAHQITWWVKGKWLKWCVSFMQHTSLAELWTKVNTASGKESTNPRHTPIHCSRCRGWWIWLSRIALVGSTSLFKCSTCMRSSPQREGLPLQVGRPGRMPVTSPLLDPS